MRTLAACSLGGAGHLNPLLPFLTAARRRGDDTLVVGPQALASIVRDAGYPFAAGGEPPESAVAAIRERLPVVTATEGSRLANRELFGRLATNALLGGMEEVFSRWVPQLVLRETCESASAVLAERTGTPAAQVAISLADVEAGSIATAAPALEEHHPGLADAVLATPYLTRFPPSLDPSPFPVTLRFRPGAPTGGEPLPDWWEGRGGPLIYVSFGTVLGFMSQAKTVYRAALRAAAALPGRVLLTVGRQVDPTSLGPIPPHVRVERWVDQHRVMSHADLVVCHGGSGTALGALAAGVPVVGVPLFADQFENSRRVADAGAGQIVERGAAGGTRARSLVTEADAPRIAEAVAAVLSDPGYRRQARILSEEMAAMATVDDVLADLDGTR